jgi:hypothetical protein
MEPHDGSALHVVGPKLVRPGGSARSLCMHKRMWLRNRILVEALVPSDL